MFFKVIFMFYIGFVTFSASRRLTKDDAMEYLSHYGYIQNSNKNPNSIRISHGDQDFTEALEKFQEYFNLTVTGKLDATTSMMMKAPRCGYVDIEKPEPVNNSMFLRFSRLGRPFEKRQVTYAISKYTNRFSKSVIDDTIRQAFGVWSTVTPLTFIQRPPGRRVDIDVSFVRRRHLTPGGRPCPTFDGPGRVLAHALSPSVNAYLHFDDEENYTLNARGAGIDLFQVAVHEIGHNIGLGHSNVQSAVMFPNFRFMPNFRLSPDDVRGAQTLYRQRRN